MRSGDAAWYLAQFYYNGWLFEKDIIKGDFVLSIGKNFSSQKCSYTAYKGDTPLSEEFKKLSRTCGTSILNTKDIYRMGINEIMKKNADFAFKKHLENTDVKNIFDIPESAFSPITTVSAPLPYIKKYQDTESYKLQSEIKSSIYQTTTQVNKDDIANEQTLLVGEDNYNKGCACLII